MKISVFGASGFIGSRFCDLYPEDVLPVPRGEYTTEEPSQVLYLISTTHNYDTWEVNIDTNIRYLLKVLQCHKNGETFNFISSFFVYGSVEPPANERMQPNPKGGNYNLTKLWAEQLVQDYCRENGIPWRIFRLANVFGEGDKFSEKKNALQYLINEMKYNRRIELYWGGNFYRDYIYIDDACSMLYDGVRFLMKNEIYNVGSGLPTKFRDFISLAKAVLESKSEIYLKFPPTLHEAIQVKNMWLDTTKINSGGIVCPYSPYIRLYRMLKDDCRFGGKK